MDIKEELLEIKSGGGTFVYLTGFLEKISYVMELTNIIRIGIGVYLTTPDAEKALEIPN